MTESHVPSQRVSVPDDLAAALDGLYELAPWWTWTDASIAVSEQREELADALAANTTARAALRVLCRAVEDDRKAIVRGYAESMSRPHVARVLGMTLGQLHEWLESPDADQGAEQ